MSQRVKIQLGDETLFDGVPSKYVLLKDHSGIIELRIEPTRPPPNAPQKSSGLEQLAGAFKQLNGSPRRPEAENATPTANVTVTPADAPLPQV